MAIWESYDDCDKNKPFQIWAWDRISTWGHGWWHMRSYPTLMGAERVQRKIVKLAEDPDLDYTKNFPQEWIDRAVDAT